MLTTSTTHRTFIVQSQQPSELETVRGLYERGMKSKTLTTKDINFVLDVCARELKLHRPENSEAFRLLKTAIEVLGLAMQRCPDIAVPLVTKFVQQGLEGRSWRSPLSVSLAVEVWEAQNFQFDVNETGWACLRQILSHEPETKINDFLPIDNYYAEAANSKNRLATQSLMRLACDKSPIFGDHPPFARDFLTSMHKEHPQLIEDCARAILRELGEKDIQDNAAWKQLLKRMATEPINEPHVKESWEFIDKPDVNDGWEFIDKPKINDDFHLINKPEIDDDIELVDKPETEVKTLPKQKPSLPAIIGGWGDDTRTSV